MTCACSCPDCDDQSRVLGECEHPDRECWKWQDEDRVWAEDCVWRRRTSRVSTDGKRGGGSFWWPDRDPESLRGLGPQAGEWESYYRRTDEQMDAAGAVLLATADGPVRR